MTNDHQNSAVFSGHLGTIMPGETRTVRIPLGYGDDEPPQDAHWIPMQCIEQSCSTSIGTEEVRIWVDDTDLASGRVHRLISGLKTGKTIWDGQRFREVKKRRTSFYVLCILAVAVSVAAAWVWVPQ